MIISPHWGQGRRVRVPGSDSPTPADGVESGLPSCQLASVAAAGCGSQGENGCGDAISIGSASNTGAGHDHDLSAGGALGPFARRRFRCGKRLAARRASHVDLSGNLIAPLPVKGDRRITSGFACRLSFYHAATRCTISGDHAAYGNRITSSTKLIKIFAANGLSGRIGSTSTP